MPGSRTSAPAPRVLLGVTGCIAAYKALELVRLFRRAGWDVVVAMTRAACRFVGPESFRALSGNAVALELFPRKRPDPKRDPHGRIAHVDLARSADLVVVAPATANIIGKLASGIADDLLSTLLLAIPRATVAAGRVIIAPAMNVNMWQHPSVRGNVSVLEEHGYRFVAPESGELACGTEGEGRLARPAAIFDACQAALASRPAPALTGCRVVVTAGRTEEPLDPVRVITNRSSGRMGSEIALAFAAAGADVTLIAGPMSVPAPEGARLVSIMTAREMAAAVLRSLSETDILVMCAAVADYEPARSARAKSHAASFGLTLRRTPSILRQVAARPHHAAVIGFSLDDSLARARAKLRSCRLDLVVANPFATPGSDSIKPTLLFARGPVRPLKQMTKARFAQELVRAAAALRTERRPSEHRS